MGKALKICFASSEVAPFAKTGGLADVASALPKALKALGHEVVILMPLYQMVDRERFGLRRLKKSIRVPLGDRIEKGALWRGSLEGGVRVYFLDNPAFYDRPALYGTPEGDYPDNAERFCFFSRGILEAIKTLGLRPQVIHCNDWQTGLVPVYLKTLYGQDPRLSGVATVFSVHNLGYQGLFPAKAFPLTGLDKELFSIEGIEFYGKVNFLKGGLLFADLLTTVSRTYAREIQTEEFGCGLDGVLRYRQADLFGIVNGIDYGVWNPATDPHIPARYSAEDLSGKALCKEALQAEVGLPREPRKPLVGMVTRLAAQKGLDLVVEALDGLLGLGIQMVILGSGEASYQDALSQAARRYPGQVGVRIGFDEGLAHRIEAGADMFLMPSRYEPCGLNQLYSLKYGTIPIVRATGGLEDTIVDYQEAGDGKGTGFKFRPYEARAMVEAVERACRIFQDQKAWRDLMIRAMAQDFSWDASARSYEDLYLRALQRKGQGQG